MAALRVVEKRVLVVEDDIPFRRSLCEALEDAGYSVAAAANGRDAIRWLSEGRDVDLIILDLHLPDLDGWRFRSWQLGSRSRNVPVLVVSGHPEAELFDADAVVRKPVTPEALIRHVESLTRKKSP